MSQHLVDSPEFVAILPSEHSYTFSLVRDGKYAFVQYRAHDVVERSVGGWEVKTGATITHSNVRPAHRHESVCVCGDTLPPTVLEALRRLIADHKEPQRKPMIADICTVM